MRHIELLIEAIEYSNDKWYKEFDGISEAIKIVTRAINETPDEHEVAILISLLEPEENEFEGTSPTEIYRKCLRKLKRDLKDDFQD